MTAGGPARVLVVDDSALYRSAIGRVLNEDPELDVVEFASNGQQAIDFAERLRPDVITMDVLMPIVDGLRATEWIMAHCPTPILVLSSDPRGRSGELGFEALRRGAADLMPKPESWRGSPRERAALQRRVRLLASTPVLRHIDARRPAWRARAVPRLAPDVGSPSRVEVVAIGASTGGPAALAQLLGDLPASYPIGVVVVQHLSSGFATSLCAWLDRVSPLSVRLATPGDRVAPGQVLVAPEDAHLRVLAGGDVQLDSITGPVDGQRPSATELLRSVARAYGARGAGFVLTGMGSDGAAGLLELRLAGGETFTQDAASSAVYGMPKAARELGAAKHEVSLSGVATAMCRLVRAPRDIR